MKRRIKPRKEIEVEPFELFLELINSLQHSKHQPKTRDQMKYVNWKSLIALDESYYLEKFEKNEGKTWDEFCELLGSWKQEYEDFANRYDQNLEEILNLLGAN